MSLLMKNITHDRIKDNFQKELYLDRFPSRLRPDIGEIKNCNSKTKVYCEK